MFNRPVRRGLESLVVGACLLALPGGNTSAQAPADDTARAIQERVERNRLGDDPAERGRHLFALAELRRQQGRLDDARALLVDAAAFQREAREHAARARTALALSLVLKQLGRLRSAEDAARDALVLDTDIDVVRGALNQLDQIAVAYGGRQDWDEAERVELDAALIRDEILPDLATVSQYLALARTSLDSGAFQRVRELCHDVLKLAEDLDAWRQSAEAFELLGHALKEQDKGVLAIDRYREGITYARRCGECALLARLQDHVTNVSNSDTLVLKEDSDGSNARKPTGPTTRFEPLPP